MVVECDNIVISTSKVRIGNWAMSVRSCRWGSGLNSTSTLRVRWLGLDRTRGSGFKYLS